MQNNVEWFDNAGVEEAIIRARETSRPLLIDFWHPTCLGCAKLFATTYADKNVRLFLSREMVCIKYNTTKPNEAYRRLNGHVAHFWHPHIMVSDSRLFEGRRVIGYLSSDSLIAQLQLGIGMLHMYHRRFADALRAFEAAGHDSLPANIVAESLYWQGVAQYRLVGIDGLRPLWKKLIDEFRDQDWAERADCLDVEIPDAGFDPQDESSVKVLSAVAAE